MKKTAITKEFLLSEKKRITDDYKKVRSELFAHDREIVERQKIIKELVGQLNRINGEAKLIDKLLKEIEQKHGTNIQGKKGRHSK